jgi:hypothetical protein
MRTSRFDPDARAVQVSCADDRLRVVLSDQREISAPIACFPRLASATAEQLRRWRLIADGIGIHWEEIDEDISVRGLLTAR